MPTNWSKDFGALIHSQRTKKRLPLRKVAAALDIDTSTLSKIEKGDRSATLEMIPIVAKLFDLNYKEIQVRYLIKKLDEEFGKQPFFNEAIHHFVNNKK